MPNQLSVIAPYWLESVNTWVFDDPRVDLVQEPFVSGADTFLALLAKDMPSAKNGFRIIFSAQPFHGYQQKVTRTNDEMGGAWYESENPPMKRLALPRAAALFR